MTSIETKIHPRPNFAIIFILALFVSISCFTACIYFFENNPLEAYLSRVSWLAVEEVQVAADWPLTNDAVRGMLPPLKGKNLLLIRPSSIIQLLQSKPWIREVSIKKEYPNRLLLRVETERPEAITLQKGAPYFLTRNGKIIDKATPEMLRTLDLPLVSTENSFQAWKFADVLQMYESFKKEFGNRFSISQIALGNFPYLKVFLSNPKIEILLNFDQWQVQLPHLMTLLNGPPSQIRQLHRINLVFPKKAIVR